MLGLSKLTGQARARPCAWVTCRPTAQVISRPSSESSSGPTAKITSSARWPTGLLRAGSPSHLGQTSVLRAPHWLCPLQPPLQQVSFRTGQQLPT